MGRTSETLSRTVTADPMLGLSDMQLAFIENILAGMTQTLAARTAGYNNPGVEGHRLMNSVSVKNALRYLHREHEKASRMTRKKVMDGMLEAIDMARLQGESGVMVAGWREIGRMCGYYAAEKKEISVNISAKRTIDKLETMSDAELLEMIEQDEEAIEGEFTEVLTANA